MIYLSQPWNIVVTAKPDISCMVMAEQWPWLEGCAWLSNIFCELVYICGGENPKPTKNCVHFWQVALLFIGKVTKEEVFLLSCFPSLPPSLPLWGALQMPIDALGRICEMIE